MAFQSNFIYFTQLEGEKKTINTFLFQLFPFFEPQDIQTALNL